MKPWDWIISHIGNQKAGTELWGMPTCEVWEEAESPTKESGEPDWEAGSKARGMTQKPRG